MTSGRRTPGVTDLLVALGTGAAAIAALTAAPGLLPGQGPEAGGPSWAATAAVLSVQAVVLAWVGLAARPVLVAVAALAAVLGVLAPTGVANLADAAVIVAVLRSSLSVPLTRLRLPLPLAGVLVAVGQAADTAGSGALPLASALGAGVLQSIAIVGLPAAAVLAVTARREARRARDGELAAIDRERDAAARAAIAAERTAMARELHDIAAHHVSSIALMAAAVERQIDQDPTTAKASVRQIRTQSRTMLDDLRRLVGLLRDGSHEDAAVQNLAAIPALVDAVRATGREVVLHVGGVDAGQVGPLGQLVAYRMVQEALANAGRHAPGTRSTVELSFDGSRLAIEVRNDPPSSPPATGSPGYGLLGMQERAALVGGALHAGPDPRGAWTVRLTLPRETALSPATAS